MGWRLHRPLHDPEFYFRGPARFVPQQQEVGVLYLASDELTATAEFVGDSKVVASSDLEKYVLSELYFPNPLRLIDTTAENFPELPGLLHSEDYELSQIFATEAHDSGFNGVAFPSKYRKYRGKLFAIFGPVGAREEVKVAKEIGIPKEYFRSLGVEILPYPDPGNRWAGVP